MSELNLLNRYKNKFTGNNGWVVIKMTGNLLGKKY